MEIPDKATMLLTWLQPLSHHSAAAIDSAFRDYMHSGIDEFFDVHAIIRRCKEYEERSARAASDQFQACGQNGCCEGFVPGEEWNPKSQRTMYGVKSCQCKLDYIARRKAG
jgi:hypothetical protein